MEQTIDYKEYIRRIKLLRNAVKDIMFKEDWYILQVELFDREEIIRNINSSCFRDAKAMYHYILEDSRTFLKCLIENEDDLKNRIWWKITGYIKQMQNAFDNNKSAGLIKTLQVDVDANGNVIGIDKCVYFDDKAYWRADPMLSAEAEWHSDWEDIVTMPFCVKLPFNKGGIIFCDATPYAKPFYCVYQGARQEDENIVKIELKNKAQWAYNNGEFDRRRYFHQALRYSEDECQLVIDELGRYDTGKQNVPFDKMTVVDEKKLKGVWA